MTPPMLRFTLADLYAFTRDLENPLKTRSTAYLCLLFKTVAEAGVSGIINLIKYLVPKNTIIKIEKVII